MDAPDRWARRLAANYSSEIAARCFGATISGDETERACFDATISGDETERACFGATISGDETERGCFDATISGDETERGCFDTVEWWQRNKPWLFRCTRVVAMKQSAPVSK